MDENHTAAHEYAVDQAKQSHFAAHNSALSVNKSLLESNIIEVSDSIPSIELDLPPPPKNNIFTFQTSGKDGSYGCPGCTDTVSAETKNFLPHEIEGILSQAEYKEITARISEILHETHWPVFPCFFTLCLGQLAFFCYRMNRSSRLRKFAAEYSKIFLERGLKLEFSEISFLVCEGLPIMYLTEIPELRQAYMKSMKN